MTPQDRQLALFDRDPAKPRATHNCRTADNRYFLGSTHDVTEEGLYMPLRAFRCRRGGREWTEPEGA